MREFVMTLLDCPACRKGSLKLTIEEKNNIEIVSGKINCSCGAIYPIINAVPRFLDNYRLDKTEGKDVKSSQVQQRFEYQWKRWGRDEVIFGRTREESKKFFLDYAGSKINPGYLKGKFTLDGGCGHGRFAEIMAEFGAYSVGLDLGSGVEIARYRVEKYSNACIVQGDIINPPFKRGVFDYIWSNGVIHHTPDTRKAFTRLAEILKKGGYLDIWLYPKKGFLWEISQKSIRFFTTRMPAGLLEFFCYLAVPLLSVVPTFSKTSFPKNSWSQCAQVIYDWYSPKYQTHHTNKEVSEWYRQEGFMDIEVLDLPVAIVAKKG
jgi:SAM-dependent methyltransferase